MQLSISGKQTKVFEFTWELDEAVEEGASRDALANAEALDWFARFAADRRG